MEGRPSGYATATTDIPPAFCTDAPRCLRPPPLYLPACCAQVRLRETGSFGFGFATAANGVKVVATVNADGVAFDKLHVGDVIT